MSGQTLLYFSFSLVIFVSLEGIHASPLNRQNIAQWGSIQAVDDVNLYPDETMEGALSEIQTALSEMREKLESVEERLDALEKPGMS